MNPSTSLDNGSYLKVPRVLISNQLNSDKESSVLSKSQNGIECPNDVWITEGDKDSLTYEEDVQHLEAWSQMMRN